MEEQFQVGWFIKAVDPSAVERVGNPVLTVIQVTDEYYRVSYMHFGEVARSWIKKEDQWKYERCDYYDLDESLVFNELPLHHRFNYIRRHNIQLLKDIDQSEKYAASLKDQLMRALGKVEDLERGSEMKPLRRIKEVEVKRYVPVATPDAVGETIILQKRIDKLGRVRDNLKDQIKALEKENNVLKQALRFKR